jgi:Flp pilus assembly protein CpaB
MMGGDEPVSRVIGPRRALPGTRAVVGALLVTVAAVGTFALATGGDDGPSTRYAVATHDLAPGDVIGPEDVALVAIDLPPAQAGSAFTAVAGLEGSVMRGPLARDAILTRAGLERAADAPESRYREVSFAVPRARALDGDIVPGDLVDVVSSTDLDTLVLTERATVIAVSDAEDGALVDGADVVLTLALPDAAEAVAVAHGGARGELSVLRATRVDDHLPARYRPGATTDGHADGVSDAPATATPASGKGA